MSLPLARNDFDDLVAIVKLRIEHPEQVDITREEYRKLKHEIDAWAESQGISFSLSRSLYGSKLTYYFENKEDATMFKLMFGGEYRYKEYDK